MAFRMDAESAGRLLGRLSPPAALRQIRHRLEFLAFQAVVCVCGVLTPRMMAGFSRFAARLIVCSMPAKISRRAIARENLQRAFPDWTDAQITATIISMWEHFFRMLVEVTQSQRKLHLANYRELIAFNGHQGFVEQLTSGRRVLLLGGHFGNWEVGMSIFGLWGARMGVVAREMDNPYLHRWFEQYREATGHRLLLKKGDFDGMLTLLAAGGYLGLLCDQDAGQRGMFVDFFGSPASTFKSIALLAMEYDAVIVVGGSIRRPDDFHGRIWSQFELRTMDVIDPRDYRDADAVGQITQRFTTALEHLIRLAPEQYFWVHRRWKSQPKARKRAAAAAA